MVTIPLPQEGANTGPPYPPPPTQIELAGIGQFEIGITPIGTVVPFSYWSTIISQYANSPIITGLVAAFDTWIDQTLDLDNFYDDIWNVTTAQGYGLDVWGRIVGVQRVVEIQQGQYFGFNEQQPTVQDFAPGGLGPFYTGVAATSAYSLSDQTFRTLIFAKAMANISNGSVASINAILRTLFVGRGNCYVVDGLNMTMQYVFRFQLLPVELAIVEQSGVLPKPLGVASSITQLP
jgi:Protein of unknown function (DUF2612)